MTTATEILNIAESQIGYTENPPNSNMTKYGDWYGMNGEPWCDMFVSWVFAQADASSLIGGEFAYCPYHEQWFRNNGLWSDDNPQAGDIVFFGHPIASHIGIVKEPFDGGIISIEGNTSLSNDDNGGAVMERTRYYDYIRGFGKVRYSDTPKRKVDDLQIVNNSGGNVYRLYNPNSGFHHYTLSAGERDNLIASGWSDEGIAWKAPKSAENAVYRMYNPNNGDHYYSISFNECANLQNKGWIYEGVPWFSKADGKPIYCTYNPNTGEHFYTANSKERDNLVAIGWIDQGEYFRY